MTSRGGVNWNFSPDGPGQPWRKATGGRMDWPSLGWETEQSGGFTPASPGQPWLKATGDGWETEQSGVFTQASPGQPWLKATGDGWETEQSGVFTQASPGQLLSKARGQNGLTQAMGDRQSKVGFSLQLVQGSFGWSLLQDEVACSNSFNNFAETLSKHQQSFFSLEVFSKSLSLSDVARASQTG